MPTKNRKQNKTASKRGTRRRKQFAAPDDFFEKEDRIQRPSPLDRQVVRFTKIVEANNVVTSTSINTFKSFVFTAGDIPDYTGLSGVFDQYRLDRVDLRLVPNITESLSSAPVSGKIYSVIDFDDSNALTSISQASEYSNCMVWEPTDPIQVSFVPHFAYGAYGSSVFGSFANSKPSWIDAASGTVEHYGVKLAITPTTTAVTYTVQLRYHVSFRMNH